MTDTTKIQRIRDHYQQLNANKRGNQKVWEHSEKHTTYQEVENRHRPTVRRIELITKTLPVITSGVSLLNTWTCVHQTI